MKAFLAALWVETLKARRSKMLLGSAAGFMILPLAGGLFMLILKDPEQARAMGIINAKAQITAMTADWPSFLEMMAMGIGGLGEILFAFITAWVFGREFSDHTVKEWLALPARREAIISAKFVVIAIWTLALSLLIFLVGLGIGSVIGIPGSSSSLVWNTFWTVMLTVLLINLLMPCAAFFASLGRGYLLPLAWTILALGFANLISILGWGDWFPWGVPVLVSGMVKPNADHLGPHSYLVVLLACILGLAATYAWWRSADQTR
jgi:ABC-type transport system involved in multi-copper enzyme maturation permease subunit